MAVAALAAVLLMSIALSVRPLGDVDFWWQHATGRFILQHGISTTEVFTFTRSGTVRIESSWLYCVLIFLVHGWIGPSGLVLAKSAAVASIFAAACGAWFRRAPATATLVAAGLAVYASQMRFVVRPELASMALLVVFLLLLHRARAGGWRLIVALVAAQALWANLHSLFAIGPVLVACWTLEGALHGGLPLRKRLRSVGERLPVLLAVLLACLATPYGWRVLAVPVHQLATILQSNAVAMSTGAVVGGLLLATILAVRHRLGRATAVTISVLALIGVVASVIWSAGPVAEAVRHVTERVATPDGKFVAELRSPLDPRVRGSHTWAGAMLAVLTVCCIVAAPERQRLHRVIACLGFGALTLLAVRNIAFFSLCCLFTISHATPNPANVGVALAAGFRRLAPVVSATVFASSLLVSWLAQTNRLYVAERWAVGSGLGVARSEDFRATVRFLRDADVSENLFNTHGIGSHLIDGGMRVFIDSRAAAGILGEYARTVGPAPLEEIDRVADRYGVVAFVVENRYLGLIGRLGAHPRWRLCHLDQNAAVFFHEDFRPEFDRLRLDDGWFAGVVEGLPVARPRRSLGLMERVGSPEPFLRIGWVCMVAGAYGHARDLFESARVVAPDRFEHYHALAYLNAATVRFDRAVELYEVAIAREPGSVTLRLDAARSSLGIDDLERAWHHAGIASELGGERADVAFVQGTILLRKKEFPAAVRRLERAIVDGAPPAIFRANLATAYVGVDRLADAAEQLEIAAETAPDDVLIRRDLCRILARMGEHARAEPHLVALESLAPDHPELEELFGLIVFRR